jgi:hypothetical protein
VIVWNSVIRSNSDIAIPDVKETRQKEVQKDAPPADTIKAISSSAHVDQDEVGLLLVVVRELRATFSGLTDSIFFATIHRNTLESSSSEPPTTRTSSGSIVGYR